MPLLNSKVTGNGARSVGKSVSFAPSPQTQHAPAKSAWAQGPPGSGFSGASSTYSRVEVTATATSAQAPTYVPPQKKSGAQSTASSMNRAAATMQSMSLNVPSNGTLKVQDPSVAPLPSIAPSMVTSFKPYAGSRFSTPRADQNDKRRKWIKNAVCVKSPWVRNTFQKGHVISLPFHVPNMNENCDPNDKGLTINQNFDGGIFTKRRMMVVLFKYAELMYCLPLYSFTGRGILSRRPEIVHEYTQLMDEKHRKGFRKLGQHEPVEFKHKSSDSSLLPDTVIHITGGLSVNWEEDIHKVGRITENGYEKLVTLWHELNEQAEAESTDWRLDL